MKRNAFTLIELLVVIALIGVLLAILMPELSAARSAAHTAACRHNLQQINTALRTAAGMTGSANMAYADPKRWPGIPYNALPDERVFICPEDKPGDWNAINGLKYRSIWGGNTYFLPFEEGAKSPISGKVVARGRRGSDPQNGPYWEFVFEENYDWADPINGVCCDFWDRRPVAKPQGNDYSDNDGLFRVYDNAPDYGRAATLEYFNCSYNLGAFLFDEGLFEPSGNIAGHVGDMVPLSAFYTSYGINANVHQATVSPDTIVLMDLQAGKQDTTFVADPAAGNIVQRLNEGARHRGKINTLHHDGSIRTIWPAEVYPSLNPEVWNP